MKKIKFIFFFISFIISYESYCQDITLYNSNGEAKFYISASNEYTIFDWGGKPIAYLSNGNNNNSVNIYSFQGDHLGWFENGVIRDHDGKISLFQKGSISNILYKLENLKSLKELVPLKNLQKLEPLKPLYQNYFSNNIIFLNTESQISSSNNSDIYKKNQINPLDYYKPYEPDYNGKMNEINARTEQYYEYEAEMIKKGYVKSNDGKYTWITKEESQNRDAVYKLEEEELVNKFLYKINHPVYTDIKKGKYYGTVYKGYQQILDSKQEWNGGLHKDDVLVYVNKKKQIIKIFFYSSFRNKWYKVKCKKTTLNNNSTIISCYETNFYNNFYLFLN